MQLDSVYQLKNLCKNFYKRKQFVNESLIQILDAMTNERPVSLQMKRRHLNIDDSGTSHMSENLEWMRINAEKERIQRFKQISQETVNLYYKVLDRFSQLLIQERSDAVKENVPAALSQID